jgi:hypothetical protein
MTCKTLSSSLRESKASDPWSYWSYVFSDRAGVPNLSVSGDNFDLVEDDRYDPTTMSKPEAPMQSLNQLPVVTNLVDARSAW